ncbi:MAG: filamentous hemagglutinin N-terminal domain-containing protein, partial [Cyanobacteria bacterium J06649_4]
LNTAVDVSTDGKTFTISEGEDAGSNLFHSFERFSIPTGSTATFSHAANVLNIISRVTGGNISNIDGTLEAEGVANLFLLNPSGIVLGPGAQLKIGGSFCGLYRRKSSLCRWNRIFRDRNLSHTLTHRQRANRPADRYRF